MRNRTALGLGLISGMGLLVATANGCASTSQEVKTEEVREPAQVGVTVPPEKFEEIDRFFRGKTGQLQFDCYNHEVEKTGKKYEGHVSLLVVVVPGGKPADVKIVTSTLKSPGIEECIVNAARGWNWPDVPEGARVPYNGSVAFKPAW